MNFCDFEVIRTLGTGSFGRVKLVRYRGDGNLYALKQMRKSEIVRLRQIEHINAERSILQQIRHPFIVNMKAAFKDASYLYIAMECVSGGELFTHLRRMGKFTNEQAAFYAAQIACAFDYIHSQHIVHRDLVSQTCFIFPLETREYSHRPGRLRKAHRFRIRKVFTAWVKGLYLVWYT